jgi:glycosyltransferase involved in cell wall biosynthesis
MQACFYAPVTDQQIFERVEFYKQDIDILRALGFSVTTATCWHDIPWNADLYFVWWWTWALFPLLKARVRRRPVLITGTFDYRWPVPGLDYYGRPGWQRWLLRCALHQASANVFVSQVEYNEVTRNLRTYNPHYIPHTLDTQLYTPGGDQREKTVLTVAWMQKGNAERKCIPEVIRSIPLVLEQHPAARFIVAGEQGSAYPDLWTLVQHLGVERSVEFPGVISKELKIELMQHCGVYLQPSIYEGFGLAVLEAMSCGAAVVSSPVGAVPEVVGDAGVLVDGRSPEAIATAVNRLLDDATLRQALGQRARQRVESLFGLERRQEALGRVIANLLDNR